MVSTPSTGSVHAGPPLHLDEPLATAVVDKEHVDAAVSGPTDVSNFAVPMVCAKHFRDEAFQLLGGQLAQPVSLARDLLSQFVGAPLWKGPLECANDGRRVAASVELDRAPLPETAPGTGPEAINRIDPLAKAIENIPRCGLRTNSKVPGIGAWGLLREIDLGIIGLDDVDEHAAQALVAVTASARDREVLVDPFAELIVVAEGRAPGGHHSVAPGSSRLQRDSWNTARSYFSL